MKYSIKVNEVKGKYYIEMMFNYAKVEAYVSKYDLVDSISSMAYVLSSIKYNKNTIEAELASTEDDYGTSYYFRGAVTNNYVEFANKCWRIVRVSGDGSV